MDDVLTLFLYEAQIVFHIGNDHLGSGDLVKRPHTAVAHRPDPLGKFLSGSICQPHHIIGQLLLQKLQRNILGVAAKALSVEIDKQHLIPFHREEEKHPLQTFPRCLSQQTKNHKVFPFISSPTHHGSICGNRNPLLRSSRYGDLVYE